jgi:hypothetical protein
VDIHNINRGNMFQMSNRRGNIVLGQMDNGRWSNPDEQAKARALSPGTPAKPKRGFWKD